MQRMAADQELMILSPRTAIGHHMDQTRPYEFDVPEQHLENGQRRPWKILEMKSPTNNFWK